MNRVLVALVTAATVLISLSTLAHANLIVNNSFEDPVVAVGGARIFAAASTPPLGWSVVGPGSLAIIGGGFTQFGFSFPAQDGVQWLDLTGISSNQPIGIQQVVATVPGTTYDLSFWVGNVVGFISTASTSTVNLFIDGILALAATNTQGGTTLDWQRFTTSFTATGATTTLAFFNGDPRTDESNGLDNIVLTVHGATDGTVPQPAALLLLAAGLAGLAAVRWCQKGSW
jgi:hypothetical protein